MPTLELHDDPVVPDAWHRVMAPGGYESWCFDAEDRNSDVQVVVTFSEGYAFHPQYLRRQARYLRHPTRRLPPVPADYPCVFIGVYENGQLLAQTTTRYAMSDFQASVRQLDVQIGAHNRLERQADESYRVIAAGQSPAGARLDVELLFRPRMPSLPERNLLRPAERALHRWIIAAPLCDVGGVIRLATGAGPAREIVFTGLGYHDHRYGTAPLGVDMRRWMSGRLLFDDRAVTFHFARPADRVRADEVQLLEAARDASSEIPVHHVSGAFNERTRERLYFPAYLQFDHALLLTNPRVVGASAFDLRLLYDARWRNQGGQAFCHIAYPHRLRWPVLGRVIERSIGISGTAT